MSALPFGSGSALPYGSAYPAPIYGGSSLPSAYPTSYPSYGAGFQSYPTFSVPAYPSYAGPGATPIPAPAPLRTSQIEDIAETRKRTELEAQLELVKDLEKQLEAEIYEIELEHVKLNQKHSSDYNSLFQKQTSVLTAQTQKVINAFRDVPDRYHIEEPKPQFPPLGSSMPGEYSTAPKTHPMQKLQEIQNSIVRLRQKYDEEIEKAIKAQKNPIH